MLAAKAHELKLEVLLEIHSEQELEYIEDNIDMVGSEQPQSGNFPYRRGKLLPTGREIT